MSRATIVTSVKARYNEQLRRFPYPLDASQEDQYQLLCATLARAFTLAPSSSIVLRYKDEDGDWITIRSMPELSVALSIATDTILRLEVDAVQSQAAPAATQGASRAPMMPTMMPTTDAMLAPVSGPQYYEPISPSRSVMASSGSSSAPGAPLLPDPVPSMRALATPASFADRKTHV